MQGGLYVGVLDTSSNTWLVTSYFWSGQSNFDNHEMAAAFSLDRHVSVRVIVSNWSPEPHASTWRLRSAAVLREDSAN